MRKIIAITQLSLDGVMQAPGGPEEDPRNGFTHGGWFMGHGDKGVMQALTKTIGEKFDLLLGRRTYDIWAPYWPQHDDNPVGKAFNRVTKYVVTHRAGLTWEKSQAINGDIVKAIRRLKKSKGPSLHVWGSGNLLQTLMAANLVDEHRFWIAPIVLGQGNRLFETGLPSQALTLIEAHTTTPKGVIIATYRPTKSNTKQRRS